MAPLQLHAKRQDGKTRWYHWYSATDTKEERKLVFKLDMLILVYSVVAYWIKYIDQSNLTNAYVAGMKEDLSFNGDQLVQIQSMYIVGAVVGQLPFTFLFPMYKMNYIVPGLEIGWGIFTLLQYRAQGYAEMMAYRFFVGIFEAAFFPGVHFVLGAWYRGDEIGRRAGIFYVGQMLGTLTAGLITSGTSAHMDGVAGLAGWRWMFIITALMTIPVGVAGIFIWPGTPAKPNLLFLTHDELERAKARLKVDKYDVTQDLQLTRVQLFRQIFTSWKTYILAFWTILFWNAGGTSSGGYLLWLKSLKRYDAAKINQLGTTAPALGIGYVLFINFSADLFLGRAGALSLAQGMNLVGMIILAIWKVPESAKWVAFNLQYFSVAMSSVLYSWINTIYRSDNQSRSIVLTTVNLIAQSTTAWTSILVFKTSEAPRFLKGWTFCGVCAFSCILFTLTVIKPLSDRVERRLGEASASESGTDGGEGATGPEETKAVGTAVDVKALVA